MGNMQVRKMTFPLLGTVLLCPPRYPFFRVSDFVLGSPFYMNTQGTRGKTKIPLATTQREFQAKPQQAAAISHKDGPAAFIAAAGTGKTSILVQRLVHLIADQGIAPESLLCVTFTRAAADEMEKRATKALRARGMAAKDIKPLRVVTFH